MQIEINDPAGYRHSITSRNPETIGRWIIETFTEMAQTGWDMQKYPPRITVFPSMNWDTREADWVQDTRIICSGIEASNPEQMLSAMKDQLAKYAH
jgi:hypothetical protein